MTTPLHPTIKDIPMPDRIKHLPRTENGYPILYFAAVNPTTGKYDLRVMDPVKRVSAVNRKLCWLCGQPLGRNMTFVAGPMCCVTRTSSEPPCHYECARYAAIACPFLTRPKAHRRESDLPDDMSMPGCGIKRNPGVAALWTTRSYRVWKTHDGNFLITMGDPEHVEWWAEARQATYSEVAESIESGAPLLFEQCDKDRNPDEARHELTKQFAALFPLLRDLPGREAHTAAAYGLDETIMIAVRADEVAWFRSHPDEEFYIRPARVGEYPNDIAPTHVRVQKLDPDANQRAREFGVVKAGEFIQIKSTRSPEGTEGAGAINS